MAGSVGLHVAVEIFFFFFRFVAKEDRICYWYIRPEKIDRREKL